MSKMDESEFYRTAGVVAKLAYVLHDKDFIDDGLRAELLDFWRKFSGYEELAEV